VAPLKALIDAEERRRALARPLPSVPGFVIQAHIADGGMGAVYRARQEHSPRDVALKLIRPERVSPRALRRFEREASLLGLLEHPGIARIYAAGAVGTAAGALPYFAMELIDGLPLLRFAQERRLTTAERLLLLMDAARAVDHAHQRGVVHRDLKPSNILVTADQTPPSGAGQVRGPRRAGQPKVLDFGVARLAREPDEYASALTRADVQLGTPAYMSPEQVQGPPAAVDARSDVYSLGVVGYELLAGRPPYRVTLWNASEVIRLHEPPRLGAVNRALRGDVETVIAKALAKDPQRRYATAGELASDLERVLAGEPVAAQPPSLLYLPGKWAARHRIVAALVATILFPLTATAVAATALSAQVLAARRDTRAALAAKDSAERWHLWETPPAALASTPLPESTEHETLLALAARGPDVQARTRLVFGLRHQASGRAERAEEHFAAALEAFRRLHDDDHPAVVTALRGLVASRCAQSGDEKPRAALEAALRIQNANPGDTPRARLTRAPALLAAGEALRRLGQFAAAVGAYREARAVCIDLLGRDHPATLRCTRGLVDALVLQGELPEAEQLVRGLVETARSLLGESAAETLQARQSLGGILWLLGNYEEPEAQYSDLLRDDRVPRPADDPVLVDAANSIGVVLRDAGRYAEAERQLRALQGLECRGPVAIPAVNLAKLLYFTGRTAEVEALFLEIRERRAAHLPTPVSYAEPLL
jgi:tetratricopeptide (TPR) repeat protein